ncbi:hypothetical protein [Flexivirga sp. B27]
MRVISWLLMLLPVVMVVAVVVVVVRNTRNSPARGSASYDMATGTGVWFAQVREPGWQMQTPLTMANGWGQLRVYDGQVSFTPDGASAPAWTDPANQLRVQRPSGLSTDFHAEVPQLGEVVIEPSTSKIARWRSAGSFAGSNYRTTQDVVTILQGWGAH